MFKSTITFFLLLSTSYAQIELSVLDEVKNHLAPPFSFEEVKEPNVALTPAKKAGCIILAGGAGRRLGHNLPKGCLTLHGKSLFEILLEKMEGKPVAIMTSPCVHEETKAFLSEKGYGEIPLFETKMLPRESTVYSESPQGNGVVFEAFFHSPIWDDWQDIEVISVIPIDNPFADGFDEKMLSLTGDLRVKAIYKNSPEEKVGTLVEKRGKLYICEYSELPKEYARVYNICYYGMFTCTKSFFEKAALSDLPWHQVVRTEGIQYEKFVFDAFPLADSYDVVIVDREKEFWPIKTQGDIAIVEAKLYNKE